MASFEYQQLDSLPDRAFVLVDGRYHVTIISTDDGLIVDVHLEDWDTPIATLHINDNDIRELENQPE